MNNKAIIVRIIFAVVFINAAGIILEHFNLNTYIIILGFRFHLSLILPLFFVLNPGQFHTIKKIFTKPLYNKTLQPLIWIFLPLLFLWVVLYFTKSLQISHPKYFYEFGMSSIVDYPIYLVWNFCQLSAFGLFLILAGSVFKHKFIITLIIIMLLFVYSFIPLAKTKFDYVNYISLLASAIIASIVVNYFQNIYWFCIIIFSIFWCNLLAFGSESKMLIHIIFAANYSVWEGFFMIAKNFTNYVLPAQLGITVLLLTVSLWNKKLNQ